MVPPTWPLSGAALFFEAKDVLMLKAWFIIPTKYGAPLLVHRYIAGMMRRSVLAEAFLAPVPALGPSRKTWGSAAFLR